jgi:hypothetical protein
VVEAVSVDMVSAMFCRGETAGLSHAHRQSVRERDAGVEITLL